MGKNDGFKLGKNVLWSLISLAIAVLTIWIVSRQSKNFSLDSIMSKVEGGDTKFFIIAIICMILYILAEGEAIRCILNNIGEKAKVGEGFLYSAADIYFSAVTPSASGGQPASMFFMARNGVSMSKITVCLILNLLMYNFSIVVLGVLNFALFPDIFMGYQRFGKILIVAGMLVLCTLVTVLLLLLKKAEWVRKVGTFLINIFSKIRIIRKSEKYYKKLNGAIEKYASMSDDLFNNKLLLVKVFLLNFFQRSIQITISVLVYMGMRGIPKDAIRVWFTQSFSVIGSNCLPIPGAMGAIDYLMLDGFSRFMSEDMAANLELLSRGISFYTCIVVSFVTVVVGYLVPKRREKKQIKKKNKQLERENKGKK